MQWRSLARVRYRPRTVRPAILIYLHPHCTCVEKVIGIVWLGYVYDGYRGRFTFIPLFSSTD